MFYGKFFKVENRSLYVWSDRRIALEVIDRHFFKKEEQLKTNATGLSFKTTLKGKNLYSSSRRLC